MPLKAKNMNDGQGETLKNIGQFIDSFLPIMDGVSLTVQNYAYWLHKKNQPVCVITPKYPNYSDNEPYPVLRFNSVPIIGHKPYRLGLPELDISFGNLLKQVSFGLVHAHSPFISGNIALNIAKKRHLPLVATFHTKYREDFEHSVHNKFIANLMTKEVIRFYDKADEVWISQPSIEETIREYGFKGRVEVVPLGNDLICNQPVAQVKKQARKDLHITDNNTVFLFVGQHTWEKNTRMIVESLALIKDLPFIMFFIGTGYAAENLKQLVTQLGLTEKVKFLGVITERTQLQQYYAAADLFLFPSTYDTWALVVHEAAALGTPSVLIEGSTIAKIITDNYDGFLTANSSESLAARLRGLISKPELIKKVGLNAERNLTRSWEDITDEVLDRYQKLMKRK